MRELMEEEEASSCRDGAGSAESTDLTAAYPLGRIIRERGASRALSPKGNATVYSERLLERLTVNTDFRQWE